MKRRWITWIVVVILLGSMLWAATMLIAYTDRAYICEDTGSRKGFREWFYGAKTNVWYQESELECFLESDHPEMLRHRWTSYGGTGRSLIPFLTRRGHGRPGLILTPTRDMLDGYVQSLSSEQRIELYQIFCSDDVDSIREKVDIIFDPQP